MKNTILVVFLLFLGSNLYAEDWMDKASWDLRKMDLIAPGNGYLMSYSPALITQNQKILVKTGYGQLFNDVDTYGDSLLYRGGIGYEVRNFSADLTYSKNIPALNYAYFGSQKGVDTTMEYRFKPMWSLKNHLFYGRMENLSQSSGRFIYNQTSIFGSLYFDIENTIDYRLDFSFSKDLDNKISANGMSNSLLFNLFNNTLTSRLSFGHVSQGDKNLLKTFTFDAASYSTGLRQGAIVGNTFAALETKGRFFLLSSIVDNPFVSHMFYLSVFFNTGAFLKNNQTLEHLQTTWTSGVGVGMLFFKNDITFEYGHNDKHGPIWKFSMKTVSINF